MDGVTAIIIVTAVGLAGSAAVGLLCRFIQPDDPAPAHEGQQNKSGMPPGGKRGE